MIASRLLANFRQQPLPTLRFYDSSPSPHLKMEAIAFAGCMTDRVKKSSCLVGSG
ncbi:MAG: hypothetical protein F6J98_25330 [Moorea sp. SIO4G2]|uniref:hypothetical protein n=1 Tax=unclassified Moorena TaxID=2683338 RepID=UPI0013C7A6FE|nr:MULTISPECIES: hypothetical protein [unclassified Moorena]NEO20592.1 hypothetical protein [Moorena sp. SIO4A5]NEO50099.1 hypothetical protein [Moorena sp. SIO4A3]NEO63575.1 hypothetical protein [Moorena sp. SIO4G2]NEQ58565.1 hypothetical protein [Moorena sp. SIO4A1]